MQSYSRKPFVFTAEDMKEFPQCKDAEVGRWCLVSDSGVVAFFPSKASLGSYLDFARR